MQKPFLGVCFAVQPPARAFRTDCNSNPWTHQSLTTILPLSVLVGPRVLLGAQPVSVSKATVFRRAGRLNEAQQAYAEAVPRMIQTYGPNHPDTAITLYSYGVLRNKQHDYAEAERLLRQSLAIQVSQFSDGHPDIADTRLALGEALTERGQLGEAETMLVRAQEVIKKTYAADAAETNEVSAALDKLQDRMKNGRAGS